MPNMDVEALHREAKDRYWKHKDLPGARRLLEEGIALARRQASPDLEKPLQYDLASFCWPGWDEAGISPTEEDLLAGDRAAAENLRLAIELQRGPAGMANAHFMVGAYALVARRYAEAYEAFRRQADCAPEPPGKCLGEGYASLAEGLARGEVAIGASVERLRTSGWEHGLGLADQLETAARVFAR